MLEVRDVKLKEGKIEIPWKQKWKARRLKLESHQLLEMYEYILQTRKEILEKSKEKTDKLFVSIEGGNELTTP